MDLLVETVLRQSNAEKYSANFKQHGIGMGDIKLLTCDDLLMIGIEESDIRNKFLEVASNLLIHSEKRVELKVDDEYASLVLICIGKQLANHANNFMSSIARKNVVICEVEVEPAVKTMKESIKSLEDKLNEFENKVIVKKSRPMKSEKRKIIILSLIPVTIIVTVSIFRLLN